MPGFRFQGSRISLLCRHLFAHLYDFTFCSLPLFFYTFERFSPARQRKVSCFTSKVVFDIHTNNPSRQYFRERFLRQRSRHKTFCARFRTFFPMVSDSPIDHFRHYGVFTGVGRHFHSHSRVGGTWACLVPAIGVLHVRGFPARITNSSFVS
jgi:hypothetical protein